MRPIKITRANAEKIEDALAAPNGRATAHTIYHYMQVAYFADRAEDRLSILPKAERKGATADCHPAAPSASAYKYDVVSTLITIERRATGWFLTDVNRITLPIKRVEHIDMTVTEELRDRIMRHSVADFAVRQTETA